MEETTESKTTSRCAAETVRGSHLFEISGYSLHRGLGVGRALESAPFVVGGVSCRIAFFPDGTIENSKDYVGICLVLVSTNAMVRASGHLSFVDSAGASSPPTVSWKEPKEFGPSPTLALGSISVFRSKFQKRSELEASPYLHDDRLIIECVITVVKEPRVSEGKSFAVPPSDITEHLRKLLEGKEGADVTFEVEGEAFRAHKTVLAMRSPVFKAEMYGAMREKDMSRIIVRDMQPAVFRTLLHFVYTDSLPAMVDLHRDDYREMVKHLLVAADRYAMERLKLMCESILCKSLDIESAAMALALADQHNCSMLKDACIEFILSPNRRDDVVASKGYAHLKRSCPSVIADVFERTTKSCKI